MGVDESLVRKAMKARKDYILKNLETISLKTLRLTLEKDLQLEAGALKPHKELLSALINRMLAKAQAAAASPAPAGGVAEQQQAGDSAEQQHAEEEEEEEEEAPRKRRKQEGKPAKQSGPRQYGPKVKKLQGMCRAATIPIPPTIYSRNKGSEEALQQALEELLEKHGLDASAGEREIGRVRARLQQQRDLDGIDTSNIIQGGRRRRAAAPVSYKALVDPASDEEGDSAAGSGSGSDEEGDSEGAAGGSASGSEEEGSQGAGERAKAKAAPPAARNPKPKAASSDDESSEEEASEEEDTGSSDAEPASPVAGNAKSPDENQAARGNAASAGKVVKGSGTQKAAAGKPKARPAASLQDTDSDGAAQAGNGKRRVVADWSDDE